MLVSSIVKKDMGRTNYVPGVIMICSKKLLDLFQENLYSNVCILNPLTSQLKKDAF